MIGTNHGKITKIHAGGEKKFQKKFAQCALLDWKKLFSASRPTFFPISLGKKVGLEAEKFHFSSQVAHSGQFFSEIFFTSIMNCSYFSMIFPIMEQLKKGFGQFY